MYVHVYAVLSPYGQQTESYDWKLTVWNDALHKVEGYIYVHTYRVWHE